MHSVTPHAGAPPTRSRGSQKAASRATRALLGIALALGCERESGPRVDAPAAARATGDPAPTALTRAEEGGRWGFRDARGRWVIAPTWAWAEPFSEGLAAVKVGARWGYVDGAGRVVIEARYLDADRFSEGLAAVLDERGWRYIDREGATRLAGPYERAMAFRCGSARVRLARAFLLGARPHGTYEDISSEYYLTERARNAVLAEVAGHAPQVAPDGLDDVALDAVFRDADHASSFSSDHAWRRAPRRLLEAQWEEHAWRVIDARGVAVTPTREPVCEGESRRVVNAPDDLAERLDGLGRTSDRTPFFREVIELGPAAVPALVGALSSPRRGTRLDALEALVRLGPAAEGAVPALTAALDDPSGDVLLFAAWALGRIGAPAASAIPALIRQDARHAAVIEAAIEAIDPTRREPAAMRERRRSRAPLAQAERRVARGDAAVVPELVAALSTPRRDRAVALLGALGPAARSSVDAMRALVEGLSVPVDGEIIDPIGYIERCAAWGGALDALWRITSDARLVRSAIEAQLGPEPRPGETLRCDPWALRVMRSMGPAGAPSAARLRRYAQQMPASAEAVRAITSAWEAR